MTELTEKGRRTLELAAENQATGKATHCWAEGGDATEDDFEVPPHLEYWADRSVEARMKEVQETAERRKAKQADNDSSPEAPEL